jgi:hypothetical protein
MPKGFCCAKIDKLKTYSRWEQLMEWILLEAGIALALAVFIVWWTMPRKKDDE